MERSGLTKLEGKRYGEERALYGSVGVWVCDCAFDGEEDGESALKESSSVLVEKTFCNLRYPFWHVTDLEINDCEMTAQCRAPLWYSRNVGINGTKIHGVKALRECGNVHIEGCDIISPEFGWSTQGLHMRACHAQGEYFLLRAADVKFYDVHFQGKYSFQYVKNVTLENCVLDTKDAFWHAENVTLKNCVVKGEYLAWYAKNLTMIDCKISGTQPFCYCEELHLVNCELLEADLAFEKSHVEATLTTPVISIKNPYSGFIRLPFVKEMILTDPAACCKVIEASKEK